MTRTLAPRSGARTLAYLAVCGLACSAALGVDGAQNTGGPLTYGRVMRLADTTPGTASGLSTTSFVQVGSEVYFRALADGGSLWRSNGRPGGTIRLDTGVLYDPVVVGNSVVYLRGGTSATGPAGLCVAVTGVNSPMLVALGATQMPYSTFRTGAGNVLAAGTKVIYSVGTGTTLSLWSWDWLTGAQEQLTAATGTGYVTPRDVMVVGGKAFITGQASTGYGLWASDGTAAGTIRAAALASMPYAVTGVPALVSDGSRVYFMQTTTSPYKLWTSDGTVAGTFMVGNTPGNIPNAMWSADGASGVYWSGSVSGTTGTQTQLWHFGPSAGAREQLLNFPSGTTLLNLGSANGASVFVDQQGYYSTGAKTLWVTFGTSASTLVGPQGIVSTSTLTPNGLDGTPVPLSATAGSEVYFARTSTTSGTELWHVNLSTGSMGMVADMAPGTGSSMPMAIVPLDHSKGAAVFAQNPQWRMWTVTPDGSRVRYLNLPTYPYATKPVSIGNRVFMALSSTGGVEPWVADLCPADYDNNGTVETMDLFGYLNDWLAADRNAIVDQSNTSPTVADLYSFLNTWIVGCP